MATLESLARRIALTHDLQTVVRTMKALAAVSIHQYDSAVASLSEYSRGIELGLQVVLSRLREVPAEARVPKGATAAVVFGSDHGLCGRFNDSIALFALEHLRSLGIPRGEARLLAIGARAMGRLESLGEAPGVFLPLPGSAHGLRSTAQEILVRIDAWRAGSGVTRVLIFHHARTPEAVSGPRALRLLPIDPEDLLVLARRRWPSRGLPFTTLDEERLLASLLREYLFVAVFRAGAESLASEHASRLASMQGAEQNIDEHLDVLNTDYRRVRQESITTELLDLVGGYETIRREQEGPEIGE